jgi:Phospholipid methyltransferase
MPSQSLPNRPAPSEPQLLERWLTTLASLVAGAAFLSLWFWLLPRWLGLEAKAVHGEPGRWLAAIPSALGFAVALRCIWDFGWTGRGTPVPVAPPQRLVVVGFYRYVRNPMYVGFAAGWIGLWIIFGHANPAVIASVTAVALGILRRADATRQVRQRLSGILPKRPPLVAADSSLAAGWDMT